MLKVSVELFVVTKVYNAINAYLYIGATIGGVFWVFGTIHFFVEKLGPIKSHKNLELKHPPPSNF